MELPICVTCGVQYGAAAASCPVCEDPRQYVPGRRPAVDDARGAARPTTTTGSRDEGAFTRRSAPTPQVRHRPARAAGPARRRAVGLRHAARRRDRRDRRARRRCARSRSRTRTTTRRWSSGRSAFDCPVLLHEDDREWVMRPTRAIEYWSGETYDLGGGMTLIRCGGHFAGGTVLHRGGDLLAGDIVQVIPDRGVGVVHVLLSRTTSRCRTRRCGRSAPRWPRSPSSGSTARGGEPSSRRTAAVSSAAPLQRYVDCIGREICHELDR